MNTSPLIPRGYKQTEVGVIPEEWTLRKLEDVSTISRLAGAEYTSLWQETLNGQIIALRGFNIGRGKIIERDLVRISNELSLKLKRSRLCKGDVVYPCVGSIGNAAVIEEDSKYHIQQNIARVTPDSAVLNSKYLANYFMSFLGEREVSRFNASSSQPSVLVGSLRQYRIPLPPTKAEQEAIAEALSDADALIESLDQLIAKKRNLKQAAMQELLTGKKRLPGFTIKSGYKQTEMGVIPEDWYLAYLGDITIKIGSGITPTGGERVYKNEGRVFIRSQNVGWGTLLLDDVAFIDDITHCTFQGSEIEVDDVFLNITGASIGRSAVADSRVEHGNVNQHVCIIRTNQAQLAPRYLNLFLISSRGQKLIDSFQSGGNRQGLNFGQIRSFRLALPQTITEQTAIAEVLSDMDTELKSLETKLAKVRAFKLGMMQELLTGKIRLI